MENFDIAKILSYGVIGLGFLLAVMAYNLLAKEQAKDSPHQAVLTSISRFMIFSLSLAVIGLGSELIRSYLSLQQAKLSGGSSNTTTDEDKQRAASKGYPLLLNTKITSEEIKNNGVRFDDALNLVNVSKADQKRICIVGQSDHFVPNKEIVVSWKLLNSVGVKSDEYTYALTPRSSDWKFWSCRETFTQDSVGAYKFLLTVAGNAREQLFNLVD